MHDTHLVGVIEDTRVVWALVAPPRVTPVDCCRAVVDERLRCVVCCHIPTTCIVPEPAVKLVKAVVMHVHRKRTYGPADTVPTVVGAWGDAGPHWQTAGCVHRPKKLHQRHICTGITRQASISLSCAVSIELYGRQACLGAVSPDGLTTIQVLHV